MRILKFVSKISLNLAELINSGIVSYIVTKIAENTEDDKKVEKNIKENVVTRAEKQFLSKKEPMSTTHRLLMIIILMSIHEKIHQIKWYCTLH